MTDVYDDDPNRLYWDEIAGEYNNVTKITCADFHYGPLIPGDSALGLLPDALHGKRCLELACGAGQNSIYLAGLGAECVALDISTHQLDFGRSLAKQHNVDIDFRRASIDELPFDDLGPFDLVHSAFGLPFSMAPASVVRSVAERLLNPGGILLFSVTHPLFSGEWLHADSDSGIFVQDYFNLPADLRWCDDGETVVISHNYTVGHTLDWLLQAGLEVTAVLEPEAMDVNGLSPEETAAAIPYFSEAWMELYPQLACIPVALICRAALPAKA